MDGGVVVGEWRVVRALGFLGEMGTFWNRCYCGKWVIYIYQTKLTRGFFIVVNPTKHTHTHLNQYTAR